MKRHLLVFDDGNGDEVDLQFCRDAWTNGAQDAMRWMIMFAFVKSALSSETISDRFMKFAGSSLFFVADVSASDCSGRMPGSFWDYLKNVACLKTAAE